MYLGVGVLIFRYFEDSISRDPEVPKYSDFDEADAEFLRFRYFEIPGPGSPIFRRLVILGLWDL